MSLLVPEGLRGARGADPDRNPHKRKSIPVKPFLPREEGAFGGDKSLTANFTFQQPSQRRLVPDGARLVEVGTHDELMAKSGQYAELYSIQAAAYR